MENPTHEVTQDTTHNLTIDTQKRDADISPKMARQHYFLEAFVQNKFNISSTCTQVGVNRQTFYDWRKNDPEFVMLHNNLLAMRSDFIESQLLKLVESGNLIATLFSCKAYVGLSEDGPKPDTVNDDGLESDQIDAMVSAHRVSLLSTGEHRRELELKRGSDKLEKEIRDLRFENEKLKNVISEYLDKYGDE